MFVDRYWNYTSLIIMNNAVLSVSAAFDLFHFVQSRAAADRYLSSTQYSRILTHSFIAFWAGIVCLVSRRYQRVGPLYFGAKASWVFSN